MAMCDVCVMYCGWAVRVVVVVSCCAVCVCAFRSFLHIRHRAFSRHTRERLGQTVCLSLSLFLSLSLVGSFFLFSMTMTMIARPVGSLCTQSPRARGHVPWLIPCRAIMFASCKKQLSKNSCASLVPLGMKWACICAGDGEVFEGIVMCLCCVCLCVLMCVNMCCSMLSLLSSLCCWLRQCWRRCIGCCMVCTNDMSRRRRVQKQTMSVIVQKLPA